MYKCNSHYCYFKRYVETSEEILYAYINDCLSFVFCVTTILTLLLFSRRPQGQEIYAGVFTEITQLQTVQDINMTSFTIFS